MIENEHKCVYDRFSSFSYYTRYSIKVKFVVSYCYIVLSLVYCSPSAIQTAYESVIMLFYQQILFIFLSINTGFVELLDRRPACYELMHQFLSNLLQYLLKK